MKTTKKIKCEKCDERGYIVDTPFPNYSGHSCGCGWAIQQSEERLRKMFPTIESLFGYASKRVEEKKALCNENK